MKQLIVALALFSATSCVSTTSRVETKDALEFLNNHPDVVRSYNKLTSFTTYKYKPIRSSSTITVDTFEDKYFWYTLSYMSDELFTISYEEEGLGQKKGISGFRISGPLSLNYDGEDKLMVRCRIYVQDGSSIPFIEVRESQYADDDWNLECTVKMLPNGLFWVYGEEEKPWGSK